MGKRIKKTAKIGTQQSVFRPRARMLLLLGDQLIRDANLAVFELVKNAYDADASMCTVTLNDIEDPSASIVVEDNGTGMDWETVMGVWLEPGTDHKAEQRRKKCRSKKYHRLPLGEKGVGRFAVHKLGEHITLVTRKAGQDEIVISVDWKQFASAQYLEDVPVTVQRRKPEYFLGRTTGTRIEVTRLWPKNRWIRGRVRNLARSITSICSPFDEKEDFLAELVLAPSSNWLDGLLDVWTVLDQAIFVVNGWFENDTLSFDYTFRPLKAMGKKISGRKRHYSGSLALPIGKKSELLDLTPYRIGRAKFNFYIFDREPAVLNLTTGDKAGLKQFLDQSGGIRVYRDGVRVYDFGEPGNDWLDLGGRRVNIPSVRISNNQILGAVSLDAEQSEDLVEKTNREGFIETPAYEAFRDAVLYAIIQVEADRKIDKTRLHKQYSRRSIKEPVVADLAVLRDELKKRKLDKELGKYIDRVELQFRQVRDTLLTAAGAGLTLSTIIHEVEKIIKELVASVKSGAPRERLASLVKHLDTMVDGLAYLARKSGRTSETASNLVSQSLFNTEYRLHAHSIRVVNGFDIGNPEFNIKCTRRLVVSTLMNLIDNSIHWLENKGGKSKSIYVGTTYEYDGKPAIIVADSGPGLTDLPEYLIEPFFTRRPGGMGLGLHVASEVAKMHHGRLIFPEKTDITLPDEFTGAIVGIEFPED